MRKTLLIISFTAFQYCFGQINNTYLGNCGNENVNDIEHLNSSIYIIGTTNSFDWGNGDVMVLKNNGINNNSWVKTFRGNHGSDVATDIQIIDDSTFILIGYYYNDNSSWNPKPFVLKMDSSGNVIWSKHFLQQSLDHSPVRILVTNKNEYIVLALASPKSNETCYSKFFNVPNIIKLNKKGEVIKSVLYYIGPEYELEMPYHDASDIICANDSGYIITGSTYFERYPYILKIDNELNQIWYKVFKYDNWIYKTNNIIMVDDGYIILGQGDGRVFVGPPFLLKIDYSGNFQWFKIYNTSENNEFQTQRLTKNGNLLYFTLARRYWYSGDSRDFYNYIIVCTNLEGNIIWSKEIGDNKSYNMPNKIFSFMDTLYLIGSSSTNTLMNNLSPIVGQTDIELIKIDTSKQYIDQFANIEFHATNLDLKLLNYPIQFCDHTLLSDTTSFVEKDVSFAYDSIQCQTVEIKEIVNNSAKSINIYPNPCSNQIFITENIHYNRHVSIQMLDISGKIVITKNLDKLPTQINVDYLEKGIYFLKVKIDRLIVIEKIVKN